MPLIVDNTVATPIITRPIEFGADIVVHSLTKYMGGHGNSLGGAIVDSGKFPWKENADKFPMLNVPEPAYHGVVYTEAFGAAAYIGRARTVPLRNTGSALSPLNAFLLLQGIETLPLRMDRHCTNARAVAEYLRQHPRVASVSYAGLEDYPYYALAQKYCPGTTLIAVDFRNSRRFPGGTFLRSPQAVQATGQHRRRPLAGRPSGLHHPPAVDGGGAARAGVTPDMIRLCIGIEHIDDILADLDQALG